jgi:outer membrane lipoprotein SlyB
MRNMSTFAGRSLALVLALGGVAAIVPGDASAMSKKERRTVSGAVLGGLGGSLLSNGDLWATVGGALAGGTIGNVTAKDREDNRRWERDRRDHDRRDWDRRDNRNHPRRNGR